MKRTAVSRRTFAGMCLALGLSGMLAGCGSKPAQNGDTAADQETRSFTDSLGRTVEVPVKIERIAPSGSTAQQVLLTMAPQLMVGLAQSLYDSQLKYVDERFATIDVLGAAFGAKGDMNREAVAAAGAQVVIDTGEPTEGLAADIDALQEQLGIPVVFVNTPLNDYASAYELLGDLLGLPERGHELAQYCSAAYAQVEEVMTSIPADERVNMAYLVGDDGLRAIAKGSYQGAIIDMCANNVVEVEKASGSGSGNEISLEQIAVWDPELIVFGPKSIYDTVGDEPAWQSLTAIEQGNYYQVPSEPWTWLNNPPTVNQILGLQWLPRLLYPHLFEDDLQEVVTEYLRLFYGYELSDEEYERLTAAARPKA